MKQPQLRIQHCGYACQFARAWNRKTHLLRDPVEVLPYARQVERLADQERHAFGFLPESAYFGQAHKGRLTCLL